MRRCVPRPVAQASVHRHAPTLRASRRSVALTARRGIARCTSGPDAPLRALVLLNSPRNVFVIRLPSRDLARAPAARLVGHLASLPLPAATRRGRFSFLTLSLDEQVTVIFLLIALLVLVTETAAAAEQTALPADGKVPRPPRSPRAQQKKKKPVNTKISDPDVHTARRMLFRNQLAVEATNCGVLDSYFVNSLQSNEKNEDDHAELVLPDQGLFAIFDGHTGRGAVDFLKTRFLKEYVMPAVRAANTVDEVVMAMRNAFVSADVDFLDGAIKDGDIDRGLSGACVVVAYVRRNVEGKNMLFVANAGDCRAVLLSRTPLDDEDDGTDDLVPKEAALIATPLTRDHQASDPVEAERIMSEHPDEEDAVKNGRVKGYLEPSRGIGDGRYKIPVFNEKASRPRPNWHPPYTTAEPDVSMHELHDDDAYVVLASDGLWATTDNEDVASLIEAHERSTRLSLTPGWLKHAKETDFDAYTSVRRMAAIRNPSTALIVESLRTAAVDWPGGAEYSGDGQRLSIPTELKMTLLPPADRRRLYDDTTVTVVRLKAVPPLPEAPAPADQAVASGGKAGLFAAAQRVKDRDLRAAMLDSADDMDDGDEEE